MKAFKLNYILLISLLSFAVVSCKKTDALPAISQLTLFNAMPGKDRLLTNFRGTKPLDIYNGVRVIEYGVFSILDRYTIAKPSQPLALYHYPDTLPTSKPVFDLDLKLKEGSINNLYLTGTLNKPDYLLITSVPPFHNAADSTFGIRFLNLSDQSKPVNVYLVSNGGSKEIEGLAFKGISNYKNYASTLKTGDYTFEFRDQETQKVIASYTTKDIGKPSENLWRFRNFTLALVGIPGETAVELKQKIALINDY